MGDLLNFGEDDDNLFKVPDNKLDKSFDDVFGDIIEDDASPGLLDDILKPDNTQDKLAKPLVHKKSLKKSPSVRKKAAKSVGTKNTADTDKEVDLFGDDLDFGKTDKKEIEVDDLFGQAKDQKVPDNTNLFTNMDELDDFFGSTPKKNETKTENRLDDDIDLFDTGAKKDENLFDNEDDDDLFRTSAKAEDKNQNANNASSNDTNPVDLLFETNTDTGPDDIPFMDEPAQSSMVVESNTDLQVMNVQVGWGF